MMKLIVPVLLLIASNALAEGGSHRQNDKLFPKPEVNREKAQPPGVVEILEPKINSVQSGQVELKWKPAVDAESYHIQVATDPAFKWLKVNEHGFNGTSYNLTLEPNTQYFWRVAGTNFKKWDGSTKGVYAQSMFETK